MSEEGREPMRPTPPPEENRQGCREFGLSSDVCYPHLIRSQPRCSSSYQKKNQKKHNKHLLGDRKMHNLYVHHTIKAFASYFGISAVSFSQPISEGRALFQKACIGCHDMGGNILQPGATLFMKDLERNGVATEEGIYNITYYGKGRMPGFGEKCTPKGQCTFGPRLQEDEIKLLAEFVKSQADRGWPNIKSYGD